MNKNKLNVETSLQAKTLRLKNYSEKIKLLCSLSTNNASLRNQILAKARDNSVKINSPSSYSVSPSSKTGVLALPSSNSKTEASTPVFEFEDGGRGLFSLPFGGEEKLVRTGVNTNTSPQSNVDGRNLIETGSTANFSSSHPYTVPDGWGDGKTQTKSYAPHPIRSDPYGRLAGTVFFSDLHLSSPRTVYGKTDRWKEDGGKKVGLSSKRLLFSIKTKTPLVRISKRLHRHIKSVFKFNSEVSNNNTIVYNFNSNFKKFKLTSIIENSFFSMNRLISKPVLNIKPNKVIIHLFYYVSPFVQDTLCGQTPSVPVFFVNTDRRTGSNWGESGLSQSVGVEPVVAGSNKGSSAGVRTAGSVSGGRGIDNKQARFKLANLLNSKSIQLQALCAFLSKKLKKPVEFELISLHHPSLESSILANTSGYIAKNTRKTFRVIMLKLFKSTKIKKFNEFKYITYGYNIKKFKPTALVGIRIKLGGRLLSQRIVPRFTSRTIQRGNLGKTKADFISTSRFTNKNKRGAFSFTVTMGHKFF